MRLFVMGSNCEFLRGVRAHDLMLHIAGGTGSVRCWLWRGLSRGIASKSLDNVFKEVKSGFGNHVLRVKVLESGDQFGFTLGQTVFELAKRGV